ncbi:uncharacterized protein LOC105664525 isoform X2 [Ceratitis capitata]|uniref:(Mediterranean fruit fly) hypothetical protein n=1 Tax=Ceratitis capitata TaxID=7213 RepID=A0A811UJ71_CERCA|nr:uncharacterized protein LOC105664525 isoform X2 [Ceratitis capitata]CAD6997986.1 unnamed protein product [Ceratitis capitata]
MCQKMSNVLFIVLSLFLIINIVASVGDDAFTIYIDGGKELSNIRADLNKVIDTDNNLSTKLNEIESTLAKITALMEGLTNDMKAINDEQKAASNKCGVTVKSGSARKYKL